MGTDQMGPGPESNEPRGVLAAFDELLKQPSAGVERSRRDGTLRPSLALLVGALVCYGLYGAASGFFQGGGQVFWAAVKTPIVVAFSVALCLPSLYILSALMGADITARRLLVIVAGFAGTLGIFMAGLLPITWLFSVSSRSLPFMVWLHLALWAVTVILAGRFLQMALREVGARSLIAPWIFLFIVVSFQTATLFRPLIWQPRDAAHFPGLREKQSFLEHFFRSMDSPAQAGEIGGADADTVLGTLVNTELAFARTIQEKGTRDASLQFFASDAIAFRPSLGLAQPQLRALPEREANGIVMRKAAHLGDISLAGDLGWLTGQYTRTGQIVERQFGSYLSVWKRQADGSWRVLIDLDIPSTTELPAPARIVRAPHVAGVYERRGGEDGRPQLLDADRSIAQVAASRPLPEVLLAAMDAEGRLFRPGVAPMAAREEIRRYLAQLPTPVVFRPIDGGLSSSQDLGYTYGRYELGPTDGGALRESGYYVRVWTRWPSGLWTLTADATVPDVPR
jgi:ketosteroid isomerase-like protein